MRKLIIFVILVVITIGAFLYLNKPKQSSLKPSVQTQGVSTTAQLESPTEEYLFVPYWTLDEGLSTNPMKLIYFGIMGDLEGINKDDPGFKNLEEFVSNANDKETFLTVRLLNTETNFEILKDKKIQEKIISESVSIAKENGFSGIILDFETQGLPFEALLNNITSFNSSFAKKTHDSSLSFGTLLFGDTFYRVRPYDVEALAKVADRVYIMAYDFSKARGNPGPNFPLTGKETYGYDFETMTEDFSKAVGTGKLTILIGMFGYDWKTDSEGRGSGIAESRTTLQMERMLTRCISENTCKEDSNSSFGTKITYKEEDENHTIWFENSESVDKKLEFLRSKGLNSVGYWAYSFF